MNWRIAVTAAPREGADYLPDCVESLRLAGWPHGEIFAELETPNSTHWPTHYADKRLGSWRSFKRALTAIAEQPADHYAVFQDDAVMSANARMYVESWLARQPCVAAGVVSLYTSEHVEREFTGGPGWFLVPQDRLPARAYGAVAVVISRRHVRDLLDWAASRMDTTKTDYLLGLWCKTRGLPYVQHSPSLTRHVGRMSAIRTGRMQPVWNSARHEGSFVPDCTPLMEDARQTPQNAICGAFADGRRKGAIENTKRY